MKPRNQRGMTLIELLIVVVIISILAAVAYPNYRNYVQRSKRSEAMSALMQIAVNQERFYLNNNTYTADLTNLGFPVASNFKTETETYVINVTAANANTYSATATYQLADDEAGKCNTFTINATGAKSSAPKTTCWTNTR